MNTFLNIDAIKDRSIPRIKLEDLGSPMINTTYAELKELRDNSQLIPGMWYRITDYETIVNPAITIDDIQKYKSANHKFDVVVLATSESTLSEEARAVKSDRDNETQGWWQVQLVEDGVVQSTVNGIVESSTAAFFGYNQFMVISNDPDGVECLAVFRTGQTEWETMNGDTVASDTENPAVGDTIYWGAYRVEYTVIDAECIWHTYWCANENVTLLSKDSIYNGAKLQYMLSNGYIISFEAAGTEAIANQMDVVEGPYFKNNNLDAWKLWYTLDNDTNKYQWAAGETKEFITYDGIMYKPEGSYIDTMFLQYASVDVENAVDESSPVYNLRDIAVRFSSIPCEGNFITYRNEYAGGEYLLQKYGTVTIDDIEYNKWIDCYFYGADPNDASYYLTPVSEGLDVVDGVLLDSSGIDAGQCYYTRVSPDETIYAYYWNPNDYSIGFTVGENPADHKFYDWENSYTDSYITKFPCKLYLYTSGDYSAYMNPEVANGYMFYFDNWDPNLVSVNTELTSTEVLTEGLWLLYNAYYTRNYTYIPALPETGKGVIYRMIDEFGNDCPYDFKNIQMFCDGVYAYLFTYQKYVVYDSSSVEVSMLNSSSEEEIGVGFEDLSILPGHCFNNIIKDCFYSYICRYIPETFIVGACGGYIAGYEYNVPWYDHYDMYVYNNIIGHDCSIVASVNDYTMCNYIVNNDISTYISTSWTDRTMKVVKTDSGVEIFEEKTPLAAADVPEVVELSTYTSVELCKNVITKLRWVNGTMNISFENSDKSYTEYDLVFVSSPSAILTFNNSIIWENGELICDNYSTIHIKFHTYDSGGTYYASYKKYVYPNIIRYSTSDNIQITMNYLIGVLYTAYGIMVLSNKLTNLPDNAFSNKTNLLSMTIPDTVTTIGDSAFYGCTSLTSVVIPDSVTTIGDSAFYGCTSLTNITIPDSVTSIGDLAFRGCSNTTTWVINAITPPNLGSDVFYRTSSQSIIYVPAESVDAYKAAPNWSTYASRIQAITE